MGQADTPLRVLHVDDDPAIRDLVATALERENERFTVETATGPGDAGEHLDGVDCVVSDYEMPGADGIDFLRTVREEYPDLPFILYTGKGSEEIASDAIAAGVTDYLQKGSGTGQYAVLANRIEKAIAQYRTAERAGTLERIRRVVRDINQVLVRARDREKLERRTCEIITDAQPYAFAWIGDVNDDGTVRPRESAGQGDGYLDAVASAEGDGPTRPATRALEAGTVVLTQSIADDPDWTPGREAALDRGYRASAAVPLQFEDSCYGVLTVYSSEVQPFDDAETELLAELGEDLGHALHRIEQERRYRQLFEESVNGLAVHEIVTDDAGEPVDYTFLEVNDAFERLTGLDGEAIQGRRATAVLPDLDPALVEQYGSVALDHESVRFEHYADPLDRHYDISAFPLGDGQFVTAFLDITERVERQRELEAVLDQMDDAIFVHPPEGAFTFVNRAAAERYGYEEADLLDMTPANLNAADDPEDVSGRVERVLQDGQTVFETAHRTASAEVRPVEINATSLTFRDEEAVLAIARDISERKSYERQLRRYKQAVESSKDMLATVDSNLQYLFGNETYCAHHGVDRSELAERSLQDVIGEESFQEIEPKLRQALSGDVCQFETTRQPPHGDELDLDVLYFPLYDENGIVRGVGASMREISERREMEARLKALHDVATEIEAAADAEAVYELLVEAAESVLEFDIAIADAAEDGLLKPKAVSSEISADEYYQETPVDAADNHAARTYRTGESSLDRDVQDGDGDPADQRFQSGLTVAIGEHGVFQAVSETPGAFDAMDLELTEVLVAHARERLSQLENQQRLREQRAELEQQNERLEEFARVVSHDLRNPLNTARSRLELAAEECDSDHLAAAERAHSRMDTLVDDLLSLARGKLRGVDSEPIDLREIVSGCWRTVEGDRGTLVVDAATTIRADRQRVRQLFENLFRNALEHGDGEAGVTVTVGLLDGGFYVEDDGPGIPQQERESIFETGYSTTEAGSGFGLSIVRGVADAHDWTVEVTDSSDGGTRFEITGVTVGD